MATNKKIEFGANPAPAASADEWVGKHKIGDTKRLTLDIPASLHARIKSSCAIRGTTMIEEIKELLEAKYA